MEAVALLKAVQSTRYRHVIREDAPVMVNWNSRVVALIKKAERKV